VCGWWEFPLMNCLPSAVGLTKSLVTKPKSFSMVTQWLTSRNSTSPVFSAVQAYRNVSSKPLLAKAEVSTCRMRSFDISDAEIQIMSSINLRKKSTEKKDIWKGGYFHIVECPRRLFHFSWKKWTCTPKGQIHSHVTRGVIRGRYWIPFITSVNNENIKTLQDLVQRRI